MPFGFFCTRLWIIYTFQYCSFTHSTSLFLFMYNFIQNDFYAYASRHEDEEKSGTVKHQALSIPKLDESVAK
jgi:hypothetical protein